MVQVGPQSYDLLLFASTKQISVLLPQNAVRSISGLLAGQSNQLIIIVDNQGPQVRATPLTCAMCSFSLASFRGNSFEGCVCEGWL